MQGFLRRRIPLLLRRLVTMLPALVVLAHRRRPDPGARALARWCCRFGIPFALIPLVAASPAAAT